MERAAQRGSHKRRHYRAGFFATALWVLPAMFVMALGGFFLARDVFAPKFLQPSKVQDARPHPVRILTPDEASKLARNQSSHVWTEGVKRSDIPPLPREAASATTDNGERRSSRRHGPRRLTQPRHTAPAATDQAPAMTTDTPVADTPAPTPSDAPAPSAPATDSTAPE